MASPGPGQGPRTRPSQGDLVQALLEKQQRPPWPLVDIGVNLTDPSFDKVRRGILSAPLGSLLDVSRPQRFPQLPPMS